MPFKLTPIKADELSELVTKAATRTRTSEGMELVDDFLASGEVAATVDLPDTKKRNSLSMSAGNYVRNAGHKVWVKKAPGSTTALVLVNLDKASADVKKAYENRPRPGRKASK